MPIALDPARTAGRRNSWDRVMTGFVPGLTRLEAATATAVQAVRGTPTRILDLGGGPGVLAERMTARWPGAQITLIDLDPVLLALARAALPGTVAVVDADLTAARWPAGCDLITAVMTVHYLEPDQIRALYADALRALAPGGLLVVADLMPDDDLPVVMSALDPAPGEAAAELAWSQWWAELAGEPEFAPLLAARAEIFAQRPPAGFTAGSRWHATAARAAGFAETGLIWRDGRHAALAAVAP